TAEAVLAQLSDAQQKIAQFHGFDGGLSQALIVHAAEHPIALLGIGNDAARKRGRFALAAAAAKLPDGIYEFCNDDALQGNPVELVGWFIDQYRFDRYKTIKRPARQLVKPDWADADRIAAMVEAEILCRDLINTPAADMGPAELADAVRELAAQHTAEFSVIVGDELLAQNFPMIHAVGRAAEQEPRLIDLKWGSAGPKITLVGKGVCFDTGGLDLKPAASMALMKKDMGGSANVIALAHMIMRMKLPVQLRVLIPAVENAVSGNAFRPKDILNSRKGLSVEINNTDAEGRLVLADALALASEDNPDFILSMATLTGAARVAVGPDIAPFFSGSDAFSSALLLGCHNAQDPVWELPFWDPYEAMIEPDIA
ncbi:MAG TPA: leucyl aminopeptidase, partial [Rhodobacteraceae bacterium]|nr:leucyl aminopeptidase [Paracoccaceae bacterium]